MSGLSRTPGKRVWANPHRGFESRPLRQIARFHAGFKAIRHCYPPCNPPKPRQVEAGAKKPQRWGFVVSGPRARTRTASINSDEPAAPRHRPGHQASIYATPSVIRSRTFASTSTRVRMISIRRCAACPSRTSDAAPSSSAMAAASSLARSIAWVWVILLAPVSACGLQWFQCPGKSQPRRHSPAHSSVARPVDWDDHSAAPPPIPSTSLHCGYRLTVNQTD